MCGADELGQVAVVVPSSVYLTIFLLIQLFTISAGNGAHRSFSVGTFLKIGASAVATSRVFVLISCHVGVMLFRIEN